MLNIENNLLSELYNISKFTKPVLKIFEYLLNVQIRKMCYSRIYPLFPRPYFLSDIRIPGLTSVPIK